MKPGTWRIHWVIALVAVLATLITAGLLAGGEDVALRMVAAVLATGVLGLAAGHVLGRGLRALRAAVLPDRTDLLPRGWFRETAELASAVEVALLRQQRESAEIERQRGDLATTVESVSDGLLRLDGRGRIQSANPAATSLLSLPPDVNSQPLAALVRSVELGQLIARALAGERITGFEAAVGERRLLVSAQPLPAAGAVPQGIVVALADLTRLRRLEGVRRDFVANVSHELKTPLTSINGYAETLLHDDVPADTRREFLEIIHRNASRLQHIVDELLDLSAIESGGWQPAIEVLSAAAAAVDAWQACSHTAAQRRVRFEAPQSELRVLADPGALRQVLGNLYDNALRYTPEGGAITVRIRRTQDQGRAEVAFEVCDTGTGIPADALPRIFERFFRVDPARSRAAGGTGLGLSIVKHMVESMGGEVSAESELGKGTTIRFRLPEAP